MSHVQLSTSAQERLVARRTFPLHRRTSVCRNLFGPVDHDELSQDMKAKLQEISERDQQRWNFNFETNTPLDGDYKWEEVPADKSPAFYQDSVQNGRTRVPATPVKRRPSSDSSAPSEPLIRGDVLERLAVPESSGSSGPCPAEVNQENRTDKLNSGKTTQKQVPCAGRKRTTVTETTTHITGGFCTIFLSNFILRILNEPFLSQRRSGGARVPSDRPASGSATARRSGASSSGSTLRTYMTGRRGGEISPVDLYPVQM